MDKPLKQLITRLGILLAILTAILILSLWIAINAQIAGYENDIVWRLCHGGQPVPLPVQAWSEPMIESSCLKR
jgi:heme A synthase